MQGVGCRAVCMEYPKSMTTTAMERSVEVVAEMSPYPIVDMVVIDLSVCVSLSVCVCVCVSACECV